MRRKDKVYHELFEDSNDGMSTARRGEKVFLEIKAHVFSSKGETLVQSAAKEITKRKAAEEQRKKSEEFYRTIISSISDTVLLTDDEGHFVYVCPNIHVIFRYTEDEVKAFHHISSFLDSPLVSSEQLGGDDELKNMRLEIHDKWGQRHVLLANIKRVTIGDGTLLYTFRDITELSEKEEALKRSEQMYRELSAHFQTVREEQNAELSREIHDDLGQALTALRMNITYIEETLEEEVINKEDLQRAARDMERITSNTVKKVRKISTELRPSVIDTEGIIEALEWQVEEFRKNFDIAVEITSRGKDVELGKSKSLHVFRIVQESLTNCIRHSGASRIDISTRRAGEYLVIIVKDDGQGFDIQALEKDSGFGLIGMQERAKQCGGRLTVESSPGKGTELQLKVPIT